MRVSEEQLEQSRAFYENYRAQRKGLKHRHTRSLEHERFVDSDYQIVPHVDNFFDPRKMNAQENRAYFTAVLASSSDRIKEFENFLTRHNLHINLAKNDLDEFAQFFAQKVDFSEDPDYEYYRISNIWASLLVDLGFYLSAYLTNKYPQLTLKYQDKKYRIGGYRTLALHGYTAESAGVDAKIALSAQEIFDDLLNHWGRNIMDHVQPKSLDMINLSTFFAKSYNSDINIR